MPSYLISDITTLVGGKLIGEKNLSVEYFVFDSRKTITAAKSLFIAIRGDRHNGHHYISAMYKQGVRSFLISDAVLDLSAFPEAGFILVNNTVKALQKLVAHYRESIKIPIIGITGSNGKTIVKEWLATCIASRYKVTRSPKSYNSQIGVPISVWLLDNKTEWGIFEAGISETNEMENLAMVINPSHGIITNIGEAHQQNFTTLLEKLSEKLILFKNCSKIYYCLDHELIHNTILANNTYNAKKLVTWSYKNTAATLFIEDIKHVSNVTSMQIVFNKERFCLEIPFIDKASVENAMQVVNFLFANGFSLPEIQNSVASLHPVAMRMEQIRGLNSCTLINDSYNSDINSLGIALDYMNQQLHSGKVLILSDIQQSGMIREELYSNVSELVSRAHIDHLIGVGTDISVCKDLFSNVPADFYTNTQDFINSSLWKNFNKQLILLKGARGFQFESIVSLLSEKNHTTLLETNLNSLIDNLNYFRSLLSSETGIMVMVKALAYGSGGHEIAGLLQHEKVDCLGVAFTDEGVQLRQADINLPIMVMAPGVEDFSRIIEFELEPEIYSFRILKKFIAVAGSQQVSQYPVHIKIDTGMHRLGFLEGEISELLNQLKTTDTIKVKAVFSHLASSDNPEHDDFTHQQIEIFNRVVENFETELGYRPMRHILNSAGIERFPEAHFEMVRLGIGLHGISANHANLLAVSTLKTHIAQIKQIPSGETIGYNRKGKAEKDKKIAILPIGYADGLDRKLGNGNAYVTIAGKKAWYIGSICMDMSMVDISNIDCAEGNEVIVFGINPSITELAKKIETIPYEVLTNVSSRVKRVYLKD